MQPLLRHTLGLLFITLGGSLIACSGSSDGGDDLGADGVGVGGSPANSGGASSSGGSGGTVSASGGATGSGGSSTTSSVADLLGKDDWEAMFPNHAALYSYEGFIEATKHPLFAGFAATGSDETRRRELAAFLGNIAQETTGGWPDAPGGQWAWGLYFSEESGCESGQCPGYCVPCDPANPPPEGCYQCAAGKSYHGRGPLQISYNFNYGRAAEALGEPILAQPELVGTDGKVAFEAALWFWMTAKSGGTVTCHDVMVAGTGFGAAIRVINGIECNGAHPAKIDGRIAHFERAAAILGVTVGDNLRC
ncbi:MAG TPA: chitinase [Polyangiaceae bacterium]|nr:chitinase [Polyangiaceae bacterium]